MKKKITLLLISALAAMGAMAQETTTAQPVAIEKRVEALEKDITKLKKLKVSGYIQGQFQWGQEAASLKVGSPNENPENSFNRIGIRRGRVKFTFEESIAMAVFQLDITDKGEVGIKDAYLNIKDPWIGSMAFRAGVFDRPFGYEIGYSSSRRESPERSAVFQTLFPDERDLGAMLVLQAPKSSPWSILKLEAGLFSGNGIKKETDNKKDFIGHLSAAKNWSSVSLSGGMSYYNGRVYQGSQNVYKMDGKKFVLDDNAGNKGSFAKREYVGFDAQLTVKSTIGATQLRGEYLFGKQPGTSSSTKSPNSSNLPTADTYVRDFRGGYVMLVQDIADTPFAVVGKFDWYDPNTKVSKDQVGINGTGKADISRNTLGLGALWNATSSIRVQAYYEFNDNEKTQHIAGFDKNAKDDVFTLRLQYKF